MPVPAATPRPTRNWERSPGPGPGQSPGSPVRSQDWRALPDRLLLGVPSRRELAGLARASGACYSCWHPSARSFPACLPRLHKPTILGNF